MAEGKLADDIQDPRLEEPANDTQCKENILPSEPPSAPLVSSEERKRKRQGPKIPKRSKAVKDKIEGAMVIPRRIVKRRDRKNVDIYKKD
ncbi:unnamed protein product [Cyprideis torosa]|uniref:Uncharacterized protein n=1 Tax=Cyprideis torosa TaxID=163714 RepID=A0A7R8ZR13_9CRUS|nr:unnamed protein product [Cyprideis torosa]CAG0902613.1 unnamed protein product [Cyprideis torosa]